MIMTPDPVSSASSRSPQAAPWGKWVVAIAAIALGGLLFLGVRTNASGGSLEALAAAATPFDQAIANGKPTLVEFYANWCTSCRAMAPELAKLKERYGDRVNFSMLNVDNAKWLPEVLSYRVDGIPHFVFLDGMGTDVGQAIGEQPAAVMVANLEVLASGGVDLPYTMSTGTTSALGTADVNAADMNAADVDAADMNAADMNAAESASAQAAPAQAAPAQSFPTRSAPTRRPDDPRAHGVIAPGA